jgi:hypothetical protein
MTVATKEPETESVLSKAAQEQAASLERSLQQPDAAAPTDANSSKQQARKAKQSRRVTTLYVVLGVVAVIAALGLAGRHAAQVGLCQLSAHVTLEHGAGKLLWQRSVHASGCTCSCNMPLQCLFECQHATRVSPAATLNRTSACWQLCRITCSASTQHW